VNMSSSTRVTKKRTLAEDYGGGVDEDLQAYVDDDNDPTQSSDAVMASNKLSQRIQKRLTSLESDSSNSEYHDFSSLKMKPDHPSRPVLERLSKNHVPQVIIQFIKECTASYGKAKLVLHHNEYYVESLYPNVLKRLLEEESIRRARVKDDLLGAGASSTYNATGEFLQKEISAEDQANKQYEQLLMEDYDQTEDQQRAKAAATSAATVQTVSFRIRKTQVEQVKRACLEYDFRNDKSIPDIDMDLKPTTRIREYQEKSLSKMFGNGRARSGIIVLPCGAGKTLTGASVLGHPMHVNDEHAGVTAASTIKKSCLCLCTSAVSVEQWTAQFKMWTSIPEKKIARFTSVAKDYIDPVSGVIVTTYTMVAFGGNRAAQSAAVMDIIQSREWGCILLDEVHVVPAKMFRKVIGSIACHCKLGLTATLVREDDLIGDLNFLIGPKLYEANWMDLTQSGFLANVSCVEVWCPMTGPFYAEYLKENVSARKRALLYVANPNKFSAAEYLIKYHEERGDKILLFSDDVFALRLYATKLQKGFIYGGTGERERMRLLQSFRSSPHVNVICISKVGDTSIDLPEANVIIQVSSHFGSRRQEAQRLGRILRPKANATGGFNAFFYTLISTDTHEMYYSNKRQQYLVDQGYTFKVVTELYDKSTFEGATPQLSCSPYHMRFCGYAGVFTNKEAQSELLAEVLEAQDLEKFIDDENAEISKIGGDEDLSRLSGKKKKTSMGALSGADGSKYMEYSTGHGAKQRHNLFRDRYK
ncbi:hypothetical protein DYB32_000013, partial [Aphanomyces invadans]